MGHHESKVLPYLIFDHIYIVVGGLGLLFSHSLQMTQQVWHIYPELLGFHNICGGFTVDETNVF